MMYDRSDDGLLTGKLTMETADPRSSSRDKGDRYARSF